MSDGLPGWASPKWLRHRGELMQYGHVLCRRLAAALLMLMGSIGSAFGAQL